MRRLLPPQALRAGLLPRLVFLVVLGGGLLCWAELRKPRDLQLSIDLAEALPGDIREVEVVVRRGGHPLARHDVRYGAGGAPGAVDLVVHAAPGEAEVEITLADAARQSHRSFSQVRLSPDETARVRAK
jgi:hypothetical protein